MRRSLLVVAHEATRTGAPAALVDLLRHARPRVALPFRVEVRVGGPLEGELRALHDDWSDLPPAAVLANSAMAADALHSLDPSVPGAVYVHEEGSALESLDAARRAALCERAVLVLAVSERCHDQLVELGVPPQRLRIVPPPVRPVRRPDPATVERARETMGGGHDGPLVLGCGEASWRKGTDLFVDVVARLRHHTNARAAWVGRRFARQAHQLDHDTSAAGLGQGLRWLGEVADATPYLAAADLVVMTSREDPRPLVPIEAAQLGTPTVGFEVGGLADLAAGGAAATAPYPDTVALAKVAHEVLTDAGRAEGLVRSAVAASAHDQSLEASGGRFVAALQELLDPLADVDGAG